MSDSTSRRADRCAVCRTEYRDAGERIARRMLCIRGYDETCR
ncbi:MAG: hypothetical protein ABEH78_06760 [Haloferacaceae archaeon]